jgi:hypothetical protein
VVEARPDEQLRLRARWDASRVSAGTVAAALAGWRAALTAFPAAGTVGDLLAPARAGLAAEAADAAAVRRARAAERLGAARRRPTGGGRP